jgi:type IV pilus assembly protein PilY1
VDDSDNAVGEKVLAESTVFYKVFYITTFTPNDDPCMPGGEGKLYALSYLTGGAAMDFDDDDTNDRSVIIGGGIPSKPVMIIRDSGTNLLISVGSTNPDDQSEDVAAGVLVIDPVVPDTNFFYLWWRELFN